MFRDCGWRSGHRPHRDAKIISCAPGAGSCHSASIDCGSAKSCDLACNAGDACNDGAISSCETDVYVVECCGEPGRRLHGIRLPQVSVATVHVGATRSHAVCCGHGNRTCSMLHDMVAAVTV